MDIDALLDTVFDVGPFWLMMLLPALLSGYLIGLYVSRNPDGFRDMTFWRTFFFGIYCTLCVAIAYSFASLLLGMVMVVLGL